MNTNVIDARRLDNSSYRARLQSLGIDTSTLEDRVEGRPAVIADPVKAAAAEEAAIVQKQRADLLGALEKIDARSASAEQVIAKLKALGVNVSTDLLGEPPPPVPLSVIAEQLTPDQRVLKAKQDAAASLDRKLRESEAGRRSIDTRRLEPLEYAIYMGSPGLQLNHRRKLGLAK